jgi:hypothetical protein
VNDAAVVSTLMTGDAVFLFEDEEAIARETMADFESDAESDDARSHYDYVVSSVAHFFDLQLGVNQSQATEAHYLQADTLFLAAKSEPIEQRLQLWCQRIFYHGHNMP